ncbi:MAG TPA: hypothetical protein VGE11_22095 [Pseudonocardia sp.]
MTSIIGFKGATMVASTDTGAPGQAATRLGKLGIPHVLRWGFVATPG